MARPAIEFSEEIIQRILDCLADGQSIITIGGKSGLPSARTIMRRLASDSGFAARVQAEREHGLDLEMQRCIQMADRATPEDCAVVKLRIQTRQWWASKLMPKKYGNAPEVVVNNALHASAGIMTLTPEIEATFARIAERQAAIQAPPAIVDR